MTKILMQISLNSLHLHLDTEFQMDLSFKTIVCIYLPYDQHDQDMYHCHCIIA